MGKGKAYTEKSYFMAGESMLLIMGQVGTVYQFGPKSLKKWRGGRNRSSPLIASILLNLLLLRTFNSIKDTSAAMKSMVRRLQLGVSRFRRWSPAVQCSRKRKHKGKAVLVLGRWDN